MGKIREEFMINKEIYMVIVRNKETGQERVAISGRGAGTPFACTNLSSAKAQVTRINDNYQEARVVRVMGWEDVV
jgi:hypothetical protein